MYKIFVGDKMKSIEKIIKSVTNENQDSINWTKAWSKKYSVLKTYQEKVDIPMYKNKIRKLLDELQQTYNYNEQDAMLVLKDILYNEYKDKK